MDLIDLVRHGLSSAGAVSLPVTGVSMVPTLRVGQRVTLYPADPAAITVGDVVAFRSREHRLVLHRVRGILPGGLITAGDGKKMIDPPVPVADLVGVARDVAPAPPPEPLSVASTDTAAGTGQRTAWVLTGPGAPRWHHTDIPAGWAVRHCAAEGVGVSADALAELVAAAQAGPCVAVTERAVHPAAAVLPAALPAGTQVLLEFPYGRLTQPAPGRLVPPDLPDVFVRVGPPGVRVAPRPALARLAALASGPDATVDRRWS